MNTSALYEVSLVWFGLFKDTYDVWECLKQFSEKILGEKEQTQQYINLQVCIFLCELLFIAHKFAKENVAIPGQVLSEKVTTAAV